MTETEDITAQEVVAAYGRLQACKGNLDEATLEDLKFWERRFADADRKTAEAQVMLIGELNGTRTRNATSGRKGSGTRVRNTT